MNKKINITIKFNLNDRKESHIKVFICYIFVNNFTPGYTDDLYTGAKYRKLYIIHMGLEKAQNLTNSMIKEGLCEITLGDNIFYNPVQEFNRDLTILTIKGFIERFQKSQIPKDNQKYKEGFTLLDALSASGLRTVRFAKELPSHFKHIYANDLSSSATRQIQLNLSFNNISPDNFSIHTEDANLYMLKNHKSLSHNLDIIDLDPYGSAVPFLDNAIQSICSGGLLCVTCTDMGVLCGATGHNCYARYNALPLHTKYAHEMSLRIVLHTLECHANRYNKYIVPLLSLSIDFYVRLFVQVIQSAKMTHFSPCKRSHIYHCNSCQTYYTHPLAILEEGKGSNKPNIKFMHASPPLFTKCEICSSSLILGGPVWNGPLHDTSFVQELLQLLPAFDYFGTKDRIFSMLTLVSEELPTLLYYKIDKFTQTLNMSVPKYITIKSALLNGGYQVSISHCDPGSLKTNAPPAVIWDIFIASANLSGITAENAKTEIAKRILARVATIVPNFNVHPDAISKSVKLKICRFPNLPPNWGPKSRAGITKKLKI